MIENASAGHEFAGCSPPPAVASGSVRICALLPESETALSTLQCAVAASLGLAAVVSAVHVGFGRKHGAVSAEEQDIQQLRDIYEGAPEARTARIRAVVDAFRESAPDAPQIDWRDDQGDIAANVMMEANAASLVVIGRPVHMDAADALHSVLFDAHRLVLVAPRGAAVGERTVGRHIVVGWKPGKAAEQTVEAALPWLRKAERISVVWTAKAGAEPYEASARAFFGQANLAVDVIRLEPGWRSVGAQLLAEARRIGGDCLLIGAFGHRGLWRILLGGVTRDVLGHADIPVFLMRAQ